jgi:alpha-glucosidase
MYIQFKHLFSFAAALWCASSAIVFAAEQVKSPDGNVVATFSLNDGRPMYSIDYRGKPIVLPSGLGFEPALTGGFEVLKTHTAEHADQWTQVYGERKIVPDKYRELVIDLKHSGGQMLQLVFRAYDEGAAFRYLIPASTSATDLNLTAEKTEFRFPSGTFGYEEHATEGEYKRSRIDDIQPQCERPLTLEFADGSYACLAEAANQRYPRMLLSPLAGTPGALISALGGTTSNTVPRSGLTDDGRNAKATLKPGEATPWRMFVVGQKPGDLLERNYLLLNLNPPNALADTAWIKPGKAMRDTTLSTANSKAIINFASTAGISYVELDDGWYGPIDAKTGDASTARKPNLDIEEIVRYGKEKNVGLILYVDWRQANHQRDDLFALYEKWGVKGLKLGFVQVGPQAETAWITDTIRKAAEHHLLLNIHDGYRSTGLSRTYPNLMTVEGIRGNEHFPTAEHNCTLPFTRYIAGPGDYTVCYYDGRLKTTHAHQLAMAVVSYSPLQWILWYDKPTAYHNEPEIEFFQKVPTVWDETKVLAGEIGKYAVIARRSGDDWFIGAINGADARELQVPLAFLEGGKAYTAHQYTDDDSAATRTKVTVDVRPVDSKAVLNLPLKASGGAAIWLHASSEK